MCLPLCDSILFYGIFRKRIEVDLGAAGLLIDVLDQGNVIRELIVLLEESEISNVSTVEWKSSEDTCSQFNFTEIGYPTRQSILGREEICVQVSIGLTEQTCDSDYSGPHSRPKSTN